MKLDELKKMIAEEFESYMKEDEVDVSVGADDVDMDADMEPGMGEEQSPEDALEKIYQMLQAYFEGDNEDNDGDGVEDEPGEEPVDEMEAELEENSTTAAQYQKTGFAAGKAGKGGTGYDGKAGKGGTGYDAGSKALQERFQKLANIKNTLKG